ncbi:MAG: VacJ family lipoprotein [Candidatus Rokubacteria bacterium]|nr:VacJ family lipoprotein [Candidatus Rokubacteria bacterium]
MGQKNERSSASPAAFVTLLVAVGLGVASCASAPVSIEFGAGPTASAAGAGAAAGVGSSAASDVTNGAQVALAVEPDEPLEYDPWEPFNERMFAFNHGLDRHVMKPVATGWDKVVPERAQRALKNAFQNASMPKRFVNSLFQLKFVGAAREMGRLVINSTVGLAGFFDVAKAAGLEPSDEDTGQTLAAYGVGPGPYLVLPFLPPTTVRDGIGFAIDSVLDPISYVAPFAANLGMTGGETINKRAENLETFEDVEESVLDLYSAVRNGYLQRRQKAIQE